MTTINNATPIVLIADDLDWVIEMWERVLSSYGIDTVKAMSLHELVETYEEYETEIAAIILDGCIPGNTPNTTNFVRFVRARGFTKPIIAASSLEQYRWRMMHAGCSHQAEKGMAAELVADLLSTP